MRIAVVIAACLLLAGCSQGVQGESEQSDPTLTVPPSTTDTSAPTTTTTSPVPSEPPPAGAPVADVIRWIEAGDPAGTENYHSATRDGETTDLGDDVAFTTPSGTANCMTDARFDGALACLVDLDVPPPRPAQVYGQWKPGWVDFEGATLLVGSVHADPGRFSNGTGQKLAYGQALSFGDYRCRVDPTGLFCVNYAHQSAVRFSDSGVEPFGCLRKADPPPSVGAKFSC